MIAPPYFSLQQKNIRGGQILNIVIVVRLDLEIKNYLEESDFLSITILNFSDFLPVKEPDFF